MAEIEFSQHGEVGVLTINRPPVNAFTLGMFNAFQESLAELSHCSKAMVLTGANGIFCAGIDLKELKSYSPAQGRELAVSVNTLFKALYAVSIPTVAALSGHAVVYSDRVL